MRLVMLAFLGLGCDSMRNADPLVDAGTPELDASRPADAGLRDGSPPIEGDAGAPAASLLVAQATGQLLNWPLTAQQPRLVVGEAHVTEVGSRIRGVVKRPSTSLYYVATETAPFMRVFRRNTDLTMTQVETSDAGVAGIRQLHFDDTGRWLTFSAASQFRTATVGTDGRLGSLSEISPGCDGWGLVQVGDAYLGTCGADGDVWRWNFTVTDGPTRPRRYASLQATLIQVIRIGEFAVLHTRKRNERTSDNEVVVVSLDAGVVGAPVALRWPQAHPEASTYATTTVKHPTLDVGYFINGGAYSYGGNHLAVVQFQGPSVNALQYVGLQSENSADSNAAAVTPDGRWLLVSSNIATEVRAWPIDPTTGRLNTTSHVPVLAQETVFIDVSR